MDILAHGLWGGAAFGRRKRYFWAFLFGVLPDLTAFAPFFIYRLVSGTFKLGKPELFSIPDYVFMAYNVSHSLFTALLLYLALRFLVSSEFAKLSLAYPLHILCDIPTHARSFFPTPFLFPISSFRVDGIPWSTPWFMILNYLCLGIAYFFFFRSKRQREKETLMAGRE